MRLHDLQVGQRFAFTDKHRGKVFEVTSKDLLSVLYMDVATGEDRIALSNRKKFRMEVELVTEERVITLTEREAELLTTILGQVYKYEAEMGATEGLKADINKLYLKLTGLPRRRTVLTEGE